MSLHINRFIDKIKAAESRRQKDLILSMNEARDLHADITKLLIALENLREQGSVTVQSLPNSDMQVDGGSF